MNCIKHLADGVTCILGDFREVLPTLGKVDAVVTDPPFGLGKLWSKGGDGIWPLRDSDMMDGGWDSQTCDAVGGLPALGPTIIWGGNYYALPPKRGWLIWDKMQDFSTGAAEMAWTNLDQPIRLYRLSRVQAYCEPHAETRSHPAQKPLRLMTWCLEFVSDARTIFDPFMGSGTTGVAAVKLGRRFIGIEIEPKYFDIACRRISEALKQPDLFIEKPKPAKQEAFL